MPLGTVFANPVTYIYIYIHANIIHIRTISISLSQYIMLSNDFGLVISNTNMIPCRTIIVKFCVCMCVCMCVCVYVCVCHVCVCVCVCMCVVHMGTRYVHVHVLACACMCVNCEFYLPQLPLCRYEIFLVQEYPYGD